MPRVVITGAAGFIGSDFEREAIKLAPLGRTGRVGDIATVAVFLASDSAASITAETIFVDNGYNKMGM